MKQNFNKEENRTVSGAYIGRVYYQIIKSSLLAVILTILTSTALQANSSTLKDNKEADKRDVSGKIYEIIDNEKVAIPFATVVLEDGIKTRGAITTENGEFTIAAPVGEYKLICSYMGYSNNVQNIVVNSDSSFEIILSQNTEVLDEIVVKAKVSRENENILLLDQKKSAIATEAIGTKELSRKGASSAAAGVKKISGVSMMGSNQLFVRGLGDRYNKVILNGQPISSPDPTKKVIKLDTFSSDIVQNLGVSKVFSVRNYSDYTGALILINTKEFYNDPFTNLKFGLQYNPNSTGREFKKIEAEGFRFMGFDVSKRSKLTPEEYKTVSRTQTIDSNFNKQSYNFTSNTAMPDISFGITGGRDFKISQDGKLGVLYNVSFNNNNERLPDVKEKSVNRQNNTASSFTTEVYNYKTSFTTLLGASYQNDNSNIKYNILYQKDGNDQYKEKYGYVNDWPDAETNLARVSEYINFTLLNNQLTGKHKLNSDKQEIGWGVTYSTSKYNTPDRREIIYQKQVNDGVTTWNYLTLNNGNDTKRVIINQDSKELNLSLNYKSILDNNRGELVFGVDSRSIKQQYNSYLYGYEFDLTVINDDNFSIDIDNPNDYLTDNEVARVKNNSSDNMGYRGNQIISGGYIDLVYNIGENLTINPGVRVEHSNMNVIGNTNMDNDGNEDKFSFNNLDIFPALSIKKVISSKENLRASLTRTIVRPSFYEKTPASLIPETGNYTSFGNPYTRDNPNPGDESYLENSYSFNVDIKYELFPNRGELISFAAYYKNIANPIESVTSLQGGSDYVYTFMNIDENAHAGGLEVEIKKRYDRLYTGLNASYIYTNLRVPEGRNENDEYRQLQGASPFLVNGDLGYNVIDTESNKTYIGLAYNVFGKRITNVGVAGAGNQYQLPQHSLDLIGKCSLGEKSAINLKVKNILNSAVENIQDVYSVDDVKSTTTVRKSYEGVGINVGFSYKL